MKKRLFLFALLTVFSFVINAQETNYQEGTFILNEDWFGHQNSSLNFITSDGNVLYNVYSEENKDRELSLGATAQYGIIYGKQLYVISKQDKDQGGDKRTGGRFIIADKTTLKNQKNFARLEQNSKGESLADSRSCTGIDEGKVYIGSSNGIYVYHKETPDTLKKIAGTENPLITGEENNANGQGPLYHNQIGHIIRGAEYAFAVYQDSGIFVIDPHADTVITVIKGCFGSMEQSKDGNLWVVRNTNLNAQKYPYGGSGPQTYGEGWKGNQWVKINQFSLDTNQINIPDTIPGIRQTWYAWTDGGFCASAKENTLYWTNDNGWFSSSRIYKYDIDQGTFSQIFDAHDIHPQRSIYGAGIGIDPETDHLFVFLFNNFSDNQYWIAEINSSGEIINNYTLIKNFWFPAMPIFTDNYPPQFTSSGNQASTALSLGQDTYKLYLGDWATDPDNQDAAIVKSVKNNRQPDFADIYIQHDTLYIIPKNNTTIPGTSFDLCFLSNGQSIQKQMAINLCVTHPLPDLIAEKEASIPPIDLSQVFYDAGDPSSLIQMQIESISNESLLSAIITGNELHIDLKPGKSGEAKIVISATSNGKSIMTSFTITVSSSTGVAEGSTKEFRIYPNPSNGIFKIQPHSPEKFSVRISDMQGRLIYSGSNCKGEINLGNSPAGTYIVEITQGEKLRYSTLIIR